MTGTTCDKVGWALKRLTLFEELLELIHEAEAQGTAAQDSPFVKAKIRELDLQFRERPS